MADQYAANLSLLLHCDGANSATTVPDACPAGNVPVCKGTAALSTTQKKFGSASLKTGNANGNYVVLGSVPGFNFGSGDFTVETHVWPVSQGTDMGGIIGRWDSSGTGTDWLIWRGANGEVNVSVNGAQVITGASGDLPVGAFSHVALTRQGTALKVWVEGAAKGSAVLSGAINCTLGTSLVLGQSNLSAAATWLEAYYDEVRVTKGVARYTTAFTAPTVAYDPYPTDASAASVVLDMRFDGDNNSTVITDEKGHTVTVNGAAKLSTVQSLLGGTALLLPGTTADYVSVASNTDLDLGNGDYTLECWFWINSLTGSGVLLSKNTSGSAGWLTLTRSSGSGLFTFTHSYNGAGSQVALNSMTYPTQQLSHLAACRQGGTITLFCNGVPYATVAVTNPVNANTAPIKIGVDGAGGNAFNGYIDGLRVTKGVARYTTAFDPLKLSGAPSAVAGLLQKGRLSAAQGLLVPVVNRKAPVIPYGNLRLKDNTWGGTASVSGKVTVNNVAAVRRVFLIDLKSMSVMRSQWSDAAGNYSFVNIDGNRSYMVVGRDYQQVYNAVVQDSITPVETATPNYRPARRKLRFVAGSNGLGTNYPVQIRVAEGGSTNLGSLVSSGSDVAAPVPYMPRAKDDVADIVFTDTSGTQLDFWMETVTGTAPDRVAYYWVKLPGDLDAGPVDIYIKYNTGVAQTKTSNGANLFPTLFDDFNVSPIDNSKWNSNASIAISNSSASLQGNGSVMYVQSVASFAAGMEALGSFSQFGTMNVTGWVTSQFGFVSSTGNNAAVAALENTGDLPTQSRLNINAEATTSSNGRFTPQIGGVLTLPFGRISVGRATDGSASVSVNGKVVAARAGASTAAAYLSIHRSVTSGGAGISALDWVALRKYIPSGPPAMLQFPEEFL